MTRFERKMRFTFEEKNYTSSMSANELYGNGRFDSDDGNIPIKLPDGRFVRVDEWMECYPPRPCDIIMICGDGIKKYATAELVNS